jgi:hypothetical protein
MMRRHAAATLLAAAGVPLLLSLFLRVSPSVDLRLGPGDRDYTNGFSDRFHFDGASTSRRLEARGRAALPLNVQGGGTLTVVARATEDSSLTVRFDDGTDASVTVPRTNEVRPLRLEIPASRMRAHVRFRVEGGALEVASVRWHPRSLLPDRRLALAASLLGALSCLAFALAGLRTRAALAATTVVVGAIGVLAVLDGFAAIHLVRRLVWAAGLGVPLVGASRLTTRDVAPLFRALLYGALLFKSSLLFHPSFHFVDWPIHETLLELVYHRGPLDFRARLVDYQLAHNVGVAYVGGEARPFPYPVLFYYAAHTGNWIHHAPEIWLKLTAAGFATLALLPLGALARRLTSHPNADSFAAVAYLLVPSLTRSLLLLEVSAVAGTFFDLLAVAALAALNLQLDRPSRFILSTLAVTLSLAAYTAGFVHMGLLIGGVLVLGVFPGRGFTGKNALRLALAGALALGIALALAYPEKAVASLATALTSETKASSPENAPEPSDRAAAALARARTFLGIPLVLAGALGLGLALRRLDPSPRQLLFGAWALSALAAYGLRYVLVDLFLYQKELYWAGGLLALGAGALAASVRRRSLAAVILAALVVSFAFEFRTMLEQFYRQYLFL